MLNCELNLVAKLLLGWGHKSLILNFSFTVYPLPKIALCYIFYEADHEFPASVTCLYSNNARFFLPVDGLADGGEYTSKKILRVIE
ncbi:MAG: DUF3786 domain-containing protein [Desulfobacteraceae bacterium]|nr:DUF3786 domain-containing protein [Desulfobacteraceae bacterium]MBC2757611.1 DUF3786 domain-containing protein [Desulfobacteraceae bacterium]